ncbi:hypothetical protein GQ602_006174 [Ophiocordyceps camponoti-floridani]|uniref:Uncharacterized protein n=1 Tax=Ophiocordyceps camponoti-floridani TaxID=2030778 RepID=A0A8H4VBK0_9HYPO|nr:hypothetical protein GQ602_006174 [Ophiocordyceps camponoti-floridani]
MASLLRGSPALSRLPLTLKRLATGPARKKARPHASSKPVYTPESAKSFFHRGTLQTTPENVRFLIEHDIEPDNSRFALHRGGEELRRLTQQYGIFVYHSLRHVLYPYDLRYFDPRGHPLAAVMRTKLARKVHEEPLWVQCTAAASATKTIVVNLTKRRLIAAVHRALVDRGYDLAPGKGPDKVIRGTLYMRILDAVKTSAFAPEPFGEALAESVDLNWPLQDGAASSEPWTASRNRQDRTWLSSKKPQS